MPPGPGCRSTTASSRSLFGIPFFYWWQIFGIVLTAACILPVYLHQESARRK